EGQLRAVREWEEGVRGHYRAGRRVPVLARLLERDPNRVDAAHLPRADADRLQVVGEDDRVRSDVLADAPRKEQVAPGHLARRAADELHPLAALHVPAALLDEHPAEHALVVPLARVVQPPLAVLEDPRR